MTAPAGTSQAAILVASDSATEAELVRSLLEDDFDDITLSVDPDRASEDYQRCRPDVLLLAFRSLQQSEAYYLGLYRKGSNHPPKRHRAVILCTKEDVTQAYRLCRRALFDDYVLFWPVNHDVTRLLMAVHQALDALAATAEDAPSAAAFAAQARNLGESEAALSQQLARAQDYIASTGRAVASAEKNIGTALDGLSERVREGVLEPTVIARLGSDAVLPQLRTVSESLQPLTQWADRVQQAVTPHLQSARALGALAAQFRPTILVVDDDDFQHKLIARLLDPEPYQLRFASS
ncbi:MAG: response regulator, partial [Proteobacteria bacterium]|nr:response regulator [Pseudomonadota bacterium]